MYTEYCVLAVWAVFGLVLAIISINDFLFFRIENEYVLFLIALYMASCAFGTSGENFWTTLKVSLVVFIITYVLNRYNFIGGGDVKLLFPLLLFAESNMHAFIIGTSIGALVISLLYVCFCRYIFFLRRKIVTTLYLLFRKKQRSPILLSITLLSLYRINKKAVALKRYVGNVMKQEVPYGVALSCGGLFVIAERLL